MWDACWLPNEKEVAKELAYAQNLARTRREYIVQLEGVGFFTSKPTRTSDETRKPFLRLVAEAVALVRHQVAELHAANTRAARLANLLDLSAAPPPPGVAVRAGKDKHS